jgi:hypothetical protein
MKCSAELTLSAQSTRPVKLTSFSLNLHSSHNYLYLGTVCKFSKVWPSDKSDLEILADGNVVLNFKYSG